MDDDQKNHLICEVADWYIGGLWQRGFEALSGPEQVFRMVWRIEAEVNNGGFDQWFFNAEHQDVAGAVEALLTIGAPKMADIVRRACVAWPQGRPPVDIRERRAFLVKDHGHEGSIGSELDRDFLCYPEDLTDLLHRFVMKNASEILGFTAVRSRVN
ncbi:MAG: DUF4375 domain-containing protein [Phycisphaerales bacterium]|nr:DUF4375 domain-containing protein [Phycisphaerales bacterium]